MENWGLVTYRETALLYDPAVSSTGNKERVVTVIAHELAHMVGNKSGSTSLSQTHGFSSPGETEVEEPASPASRCEEGCRPSALS